MQGDIGAALGGIGQEGTPSTEPGGGGGGVVPCFLGHTMFSIWNAPSIPIAALHADVGRWQAAGALSFNEHDMRVRGEIAEVFRNIKYEYLHVVFEDYTADDVVAEHRYFTPNREYVSIKHLLGQRVITEYGRELLVLELKEVKVPSGIFVYNAHIKTYENYCANRRRVHNLKPQGGNEF